MRKHISILFWVATALWIAPAMADPLLNPWENQSTPRQIFRLSPTLSYYSTSSNFNAAGTETAPANLKGLHRLGLDVLASWGIAERLTLFQRISWTSNRLETPTTQSTSYGLGDQATGLSYRVLGEESEFTIDLQIRADYPLYKNASSRSAGTPAFGNQSVDVTSGGFVTVPLYSGQVHRLNAVGGLGYTWRSLGYSAAAPWSVVLEARPLQSGWVSALGLYGFQSLQTGTRIGTGSSAPGALSGGSFITEAENPSYAEARLRAGYLFTSGTEILLTGGLAVTGKNTPKGTWISGGVSFEFGRPPTSNDPSRLRPEDYGKSNQGFIEYTFEAQVTAVNDRMNLLKINKGSESGVEKGQTLDVFKVGKSGTAEQAVARGQVTSVRAGEAVVSIKEFFREVWIEKGFLVKRPLQ